MIKQNPFSIYDFLGYLIPGALICYLFLLLSQADKINCIDDALVMLSNKSEFQFDQFFFFVIISYASGHFISYLSSITIEKYSHWRYDYPSKYLLGFSENKSLFKTDNKKALFLRLILLAIVLPIMIWDFILGEYFNLKSAFTKKLDDFLIVVVQEKTLTLLDKLYPPEYEGLRDYDFHRIISHYVYENSKNHQSKMSNYVALYGFLRAITLIVSVMFWIILIYLLDSCFIFFNRIDCFNPHNMLQSINFKGIFLLFGSSIIAYIYFMGFMKFYRRYSLEAFMLVAVDETIIIKKKKKNN